MTQNLESSAVPVAQPIELSGVGRVLVVRLRSIGDAVLSTPTLTALHRALPSAQIDILLEDWVAPLIEGHHAVTNVIAVGRDSIGRLRTAHELRKRRYDVVINLHGGTTSTMFVRAAGARYRIGYSNYQYSFLYTHRLSSSADFWGRTPTHSAEQQLALAGFIGINVHDRPKTSLNVNAEARRLVGARLAAAGLEEGRRYALIHPSTAFTTKQWPIESYARLCEILFESGLLPVAVTSLQEASVLRDLRDRCRMPVVGFADMDLPQITALASQASVFVGNDSGIAHIAAAVNTPSVVIFGSSNRNHWHPWTEAPFEIMFQPFDCQPCSGYECGVFGDSRCVTTVPIADVASAVLRIKR